MPTPDYLFSSGRLDARLRPQAEALNHAAETIPSERVLGHGAEELVAELLDTFRVAPLEVDWQAMTVSQQDARVDVSQDWGRVISDRSRPFYIPGTTFTYHVPWRGESDLWTLTPSSHTTHPPTGAVVGNELQISTTTPAPVPANIRQPLDEEVNRFKQWIEWVNADVAAFNGQLAPAAQQVVERRREKVLADRALLASFDIPVKRREEATPTYVAPSVRRHVTRPAPVSGQRARAPEPIMPAEEYEHILTVVRGMVRVMERSPKAFVGMKEEDLRQHFLVQLNAQYEGQATGETFNGDGKTDILVRERDRNLFIAECKFWAGPKKLTETIDQVLGYTSWRDTKTAIFVFNRHKDLSAVLAQINPTVTKHEAFVREVPYGEETDFRYILRRPDDEDRELTLTILVFEVPT